MDKRNIHFPGLVTFLELETAFEGREYIAVWETAHGGGRGGQNPGGAVLSYMDLTYYISKCSSAYHDCCGIII